MILILSETNDKVTDSVIDWLTLKNADFIRINETNFISNILIKEDGIIIDFDGELQVNLNNVSSFWHRRGTLNFKQIIDLKKTDLPNLVKTHLHSEWSDIKSFLFYRLHQKKGIFNKTVNDNKLVSLEFAKDLGLLTPNWLITGENKELPRFNAITKAISDSLELYLEDEYYTFYTERFQLNQHNFPVTFFPTFFQKHIEKFIDIRTIYLKGNIWSMAVFETSNKELVVDFRKNYGNHRYLSVSLPHSIISKLKLLMKKMQLDYGAIDFILDNNNNYYFLEVNPYGQFEMVSAPCNYYIEKKIAEILLQYENEIN